MHYTAPSKDDVKDILEFRIKTMADARRIIPELKLGRSVYIKLTETLKDLCLKMCDERILAKAFGALPSSHGYTEYRFKYSFDYFLNRGGNGVLNLLGIHVEYSNYYFCELDFYGKGDYRNALRLWYTQSYDNDPRKILSNRGDAVWDSSCNEFLRIISVIEALTKIRYLAKLSRSND